MPNARGTRRCLWGGRELNYLDYLNRVILPFWWYRFIETAGVAVTNYGSGGSGFNGTNSNCTIGQTGKLGANEAYDYNGLTSVVQVAAQAAIIDALPAMTAAFLVKMDTAGEATFGRFIHSRRGILNYMQFSGSMNAITTSVDTDGIDAQSTTSSGIDTNWCWLFRTYDDGGDRKIRLYKGQNGAVTEFGYSAQTAATGTLTSADQIMYVGNAQSNNLTLDGLMDEFWVTGKILAASTMEQIVNLTGV